MSIGRYSGMVIGGPKAGAMLTHTSPIYRAVVLGPLPDEPPTFGDAALTVEPETEIITYEHHHAFDAPVVMDFWLPTGKHLAWGLSELLRHYQETAGRMKD